MSPNETDQTDHDLLITLVSQMKNMEKLLGNHLVHGDRRETLYLTIILGMAATTLIAVGTAIVSIISKGI